MGNTSPSPPFSFRVGSSSGEFHSLPSFSISPDGTASAAIFDAPPYPIVREHSSDVAETINALLSSLSSADQAPVDWKDTPAAHIFKVDVPGMKEDVKVEMEEESRVLVISGERAAEDTAEDGTWFFAERCSGKFVRKFPLPEDAKVAEIKAALENGVLTVTVPKVEEKQKKSRSIDILG